MIHFIATNLKTNGLTARRLMDKKIEIMDMFSISDYKLKMIFKNKVYLNIKVIQN
jgi:hypothetical protein